MNESLKFYWILVVNIITYFFSIKIGENSMLTLEKKPLIRDKLVLRNYINY